MSEIYVEIYSKKSHCSNCTNMRAEFDRWLDDNFEKHEVEVTESFIEEHPEIVTQSGAKAAPVYRINRGDSETWVSGNQPDVLIDSLEGNESIWEESDCSI